MASPMNSRTAVLSATPHLRSSTVQTAHRSYRRCTVASKTAVRLRSFAPRISLPTQPGAVSHTPSRKLATRAQATESIARNTINILRTVPEVRSWRKYISRSGRSLGLVPTMGALHAGHLRLARVAAVDNDEVAVSIYVNPTQFGVNEDLDAYPRTWDTDLTQLQRLNEELEAENARGRVTAVFAPTTKAMYPTLPPSSEIDGEGSFVTITPIGQLLEGASRPVFFRGVATVCMKLFNIVRPEVVYFGQKDVQQTVLIKRLVKDFHHDMIVRVIPTERERDGLAMSSRNVYLGERRRAVAPSLQAALNVAADQISIHGQTERITILQPAYDYLDVRIKEQLALPASEQALFMVGYISMSHPHTMEEMESFDGTTGAILSGALKMLPLEEVRPGEDEGEAGGVHRPVRLIDNIVLEPVIARV